MDKDSHHNWKLDLVSDTLKGAGPGMRFGTDDRYAIRTEPGSHSTAMILDTSRGRLKKGIPATEPVIRFDRAHHRAEYPHMNTNSKITGRPDPHSRVPSAVVESAPYIGKGLQYANKIAVPVAVAMDAYRFGKAVKADQKCGDTNYSRSKTEASGVVGGWTGALAGGRLGADIGTRIYPGVGTITGGLVGGLVGGIGGDTAFRTITAKFVGSDQEPEQGVQDCSSDSD